jgi:hypothetical protein
MKRLVTLFLTAFVCVSLVWLVIGELKQRTHEKNTAGVSDTNFPAHKVVVYYFHGNFRCETCGKFEAYNNEAILTAFSAELKSGRLEWRNVNINSPGNEHFIKDYNLTTEQLILSEATNGKQTRWKDLFKIWDLVKDKQTYETYIVSETKAYLGDSRVEEEDQLRKTQKDAKRND